MSTESTRKSTSISSTGLQKSTRNWELDKKKKQADIQDLSLVSRSDNDTKNSLKIIQVQRELWKLIKQKVDQVKDETDKKEWDPIVDQLRKLREGIYATYWSKWDYTFSIEVFELSVDCCIKAARYEELTKSLNGLLDQLYTIQKESSKPYYIVLGVIYQCCYMHDIPKAKNYSIGLSKRTNEGAFGKRLVEAMVTENPILYFKLYHYNPYLTFKLLMENYNDTMQKKAIDVLRKAYLSTSIAWVGQWIGVYQDNDKIINQLEKLVQPTCIKSVDRERQLVYFIKRKIQ